MFRTKTSSIRMPTFHQTASLDETQAKAVENDARSKAKSKKQSDNCSRSQEHQFRIGDQRKCAATKLTPCLIQHRTPSYLSIIPWPSSVETVLCQKCLLNPALQTRNRHYMERSQHQNPNVMCQRSQRQRCPEHSVRVSARPTRRWRHHG